MPLTKENYENYYLGNGAEHQIMSEAFLHGFECHKFNPDIGIDLLITNKALSKFQGIDEVSHYLQIKSTFLINDEANFYINEDELNFLREGNITTVLCYFSPIIQAEPKSFDRGDFEPWRESEEASFMMHLYETEFRKIKNGKCLSSIDFKGFRMRYIWLNSVQLSKAIKEGFITWSYSNLYKVTLRQKNNEGVAMLGKEIDGSIISEITNIYYLLKENKSSYRIDSGDFLYEHY